MGNLSSFSDESAGSKQGGGKNKASSREDPILSSLIGRKRKIARETSPVCVVVSLPFFLLHIRTN